MSSLASELGTERNQEFSTKINDKIIIDWRFLTHATIEKDQKPLNSELT
ncbi:MAG: hypothetical protein ACKOEW_03435 [Methylocystis sp.]